MIEVVDSDKLNSIKKRIRDISDEDRAHLRMSGMDHISRLLDEVLDMTPTNEIDRCVEEFGEHLEDIGYEEHCGDMSMADHIHEYIDNHLIRYVVQEQVIIQFIANSQHHEINDILLWSSGNRPVASIAYNIMYDALADSYL